MARPREFEEQAVLRKAMEVFWKDGFDGTTLRDLLEATGLSRSSLYETFGDKRSLFLAALDAYRQDRQQELRAILDEGANGYKSIEGFLRMVVEHGDAPHYRYGCMSCNEAVETAPHDDEVRQLVARDFAGVEDAFLGAIRRGQADGSIGTAVPAARLARFLTVSLQGVHVMSRAGMSRQYLQDTVEQMLASLAAGREESKRVRAPWYPSSCSRKRCRAGRAG